jgi:hypothetical protein
MKKLLAIGVLTMASLCLTASKSSADSFGYFTQTSCWPFNICACNYCNPCGGCFGCGGCGKCNGTICIKPYNAFSTVCCYPDGAGHGPLGAAGVDYGALPAAGACPEAAPMPVPVGGMYQFQNQAGYYGNLPVGYSYPTSGASAYRAQAMAVPYYWNGTGR